MSHEIYQELLAANALTALDAADARALTAHLDSCADCRHEMGEWEETAALLALEAKPLQPTAQVRERILAVVQAETRAGKFPDDSVSPAAARSETNVLSFARPPKTIWSSWGAIGAIAAGLVVAALGISLFLVFQQDRAARSEVARVSAELDKTQQQLAHEREVVALITTPGARMTELAGTNEAPGAHAMIAYDKSGHAMLMAKGLAATPKGMAYQLWFIVDKKPLPGKVFTTDSSGNGTIVDNLPAPAIAAAPVFAITLEPEQGVQSPTGKIYLVSS